MIPATGINPPVVASEKKLYQMKDVDIPTLVTPCTKKVSQCSFRSVVVTQYL